MPQFIHRVSLGEMWGIMMVDSCGGGFGSGISISLLGSGFGSDMGFILPCCDMSWVGAWRHVAWDSEPF